ncbi:MAG: hypothetical protein GF329_18445 [Candidatus Lokiarchaeota archaeon]|nr:hypothetical protein [Candidatus Lokiarchaeota archaeon]
MRLIVFIIIRPFDSIKINYKEVSSYKPSLSNFQRDPNFVCPNDIPLISVDVQSNGLPIIEAYLNYTTNDWSLFNVLNLTVEYINDIKRYFTYLPSFSENTTVKYYFNVTNQNSTGHRLYSTSPEISYSIVTPPYLTNNSFTPGLGFPNSTNFTFRVLYHDYNNDPPQDMLLYINNTPFQMIKENSSDLDYSDGASYIYEDQLPRGYYYYYFWSTSSCELDEPFRFPNKDMFKGPPVNTPPMLLDGCVSPESGEGVEMYNFTVNYTDLDDDSPKYLNVIIDNRSFPMEKSDISDNRYDDGCAYFYSTLLSSKNHSYYFITYDGMNVSRSPETGCFYGPHVCFDANLTHNDSILHVEAEWSNGDPQGILNFSVYDVILDTFVYQELVNISGGMFSCNYDLSNVHDGLYRAIFLVNTSSGWGTIYNKSFNVGSYACMVLNDDFTWNAYDGGFISTPINVSIFYNTNFTLSIASSQWLYEGLTIYPEELQIDDDNNFLDIFENGKRKEMQLNKHFMPWATYSYTSDKNSSERINQVNLTLYLWTEADIINFNGHISFNIEYMKECFITENGRYGSDIPIYNPSGISRVCNPVYSENLFIKFGLNQSIIQFGPYESKLLNLQIDEAKIDENISIYLEFFSPDAKISPSYTYQYAVYSDYDFTPSVEFISSVPDVIIFSNKINLEIRVNDELGNPDSNATVYFLISTGEKILFIYDNETRTYKGEISFQNFDWYNLKILVFSGGKSIIMNEVVLYFPATIFLIYIFGFLVISAVLLVRKIRKRNEKKVLLNTQNLDKKTKILMRRKRMAEEINENSFNKNREFEEKSDKNLSKPKHEDVKEELESNQGTIVDKEKKDDSKQESDYKPGETSDRKLDQESIEHEKIHEEGKTKDLMDEIDIEKLEISFVDKKGGKKW